MWRKLNAAFWRLHLRRIQPALVDQQKYRIKLAYGFVVAGGLLASSAHFETPEFVAKLAEAGLIAVLLAGLVDPYLRRRLVTEVVEGIAWLEAGGGALPSPLKAGISSLARTKRYHEQMEWILDFEWVDDSKQILRLVVRTRAQGRNIDPKEEFRPTKRTWAVASVGDYVTDYTAWEFSIPSKSGLHIELSGDELAPYRLPESEGRVVIDQPRILEDWERNDVEKRTVSVPVNEVFISTRSATMYRHAHDSLPLINGAIVDQQSVAVGGPAAPELNVQILTKGDWETRLDASVPRRRMWRATHVTFPNEGVIVTWQPV